MGSITIYLVIFLLVFAAVSWRNLRVALYLVLVSLPLYLIRFKFGPIPTTLLELMIYTAAIVWGVKILLHQAQVNWGALRYYLGPLILLVVGLALGAYVSAERTVSLGIIKGWFVDPVLLFVMLTSILSRQLHIKKAIMALLLPATILSAFAIYQVVFKDFVTVDQRASAVFSSANYLSLFLVPIMILSLGLGVTVARRLRLLVTLSWILMAIALYFTFSYAGWLGLFAGIVVLVLGLTRLRVAIMGGAGLLIVAILSQWQHPKFQQMLDLAGRSSSHVRLQVWQTALLMIKEHPLTGIGLGLFEKRYLEFAARLFHPPIELRMLHSHNIILQFLVNTGLAGLAGLIWIVINFTRGIWREAIKGRDPLAVSVLAAFVALLTHGMFDVAYWKNDLSALFWAILAFGIILSPKLSNAEDISHHRN